jgi:hypothetical protein
MGRMRSCVSVGIKPSEFGEISWIKYLASLPSELTPGFVVVVGPVSLLVADVDIVGCSIKVVASVHVDASRVVVDNRWRPLCNVLCAA